MELERIWFEEVLRENENVKKMARLAEVSSEPAVGEGENFASTVRRVQLDTVLANGKTSTRSLILKKKPDGDNKNDFLESHSYFATEIKTYSEVLPALEDVLREQGVPPLWPEFLGLKDDILIFVDLKNKNYRVPCRKKQLDLPHVLLAVRTLAIFHAGSVVLKQRGLLDPSIFEFLFYARNSDKVKQYMTGGIRCLASVMEEEWGPEWTEISRRMKEKAETCFEELKDLLQVDESRLNVLSHGDLWTTNLLFKYSQGVDTPIGVRFIDFQMTHYNSYACDLHFFLATSVPTELFNRHHRNIFKSYTETLRDTLAYHGYPELAPSLAEVKEEMTRTELLRFFFKVSVMPIHTADCEEPINFEAFYEKGSIVQNPNIYRGNYREKVEQDLLAWSEKGLF